MRPIAYILILVFISSSGANAKTVSDGTIEDDIGLLENRMHLGDIAGIRAALDTLHRDGLNLDQKNFSDADIREASKKYERLASTCSVYFSNGTVATNVSLANAIKCKDPLNPHATIIRIVPTVSR